MTHRMISVVLIFFFSVCLGQQQGLSSRKGPYLGQKPPGLIPEAFAQDFLTGGQLVHSAPVFSADGTEVFWSRTDLSQGVLMTAKCMNGRWTQPTVIPFSEGFDGRNPVLSCDGERLYFHSNRNLGDESTPVYRIWMTEKKDGEWQNPRPLDATINAGKWSGGPWITEDEVLYFASMREDSRGMFDIYRAELSSDTLDRVERLGPGINSEEADLYPCIADDERFLIFASTRAGGFGGQDLYISFRGQDGSWSSALNMGPAINSEREETFPIFSKDGRFLFFVRFYQMQEKEYKTDIYWVDAMIIEELWPKAIH